MMRNAALTAVVVLTCSLAAAAQDKAKDDIQKTAPTVDIIGERIKDLQSAPVSGNFLDSEELERLRITSVQELTHQLPNVRSTDSGTRSYGDIYSVRGLTNGAFFSGPSMTLYVDDIPFGDPFTYAEPIGQLESVQVLRGPQPTTFGRYSYGGVVNVLSHRPTDTLQGGAYAEGGNHQMINAGATLRGALIPGKLRFRVGASEQSLGGYLHNSTTGREEDDQYRVGGDVSVFYTPSEQWDIAFVGALHKYDDGGSRLNSLTAPDPYVVGSDVAGRMERTTDQQALRAGFKGPGWQFLSVTARRNWELNPYIFDLDFSAIPGNSVRIDQQQVIYSQEFRITSDDARSSVDWVVGAYGHGKNGHQDGDRNFIAVFPGPIIVPVNQVNSFSMHEHWAALFGDLAYKGIEHWRFRVGARYDYVGEFMRRTTSAPALGIASDYGDNGNFSHLSVKAGVDFLAIDHTLLYVNIGNAFKPGGFSAFTNNPATASFKSEKTLYAELGGKSELWEGRLHAGASVFYYDIRDYQLERGIPNSTDYVVLNAESAGSVGAEADVRVAVIPELEIFGRIGTVRTVLDKYTDPISGATLDDTVAPFVPRYTGSVGASAKIVAGIFAHLEWVATGATHYSDLNPGFRTDNYGLLNGGVGIAGERFRISAFAANLNNRFYYSTLQEGVQAGAAAVPRQLGVSAEVRF